MCGIVGFIDISLKKNFDLNRLIIKNMTDKLSHRGPDFQNIWIDKNKNIFLGHARLSILDLTSNANQPMQSTCGRYVMSFNGEIYNHLELRKKYNLSNFKGNGDSETLMQCFQKLGFLKTCEVIDGMFAISLFDKFEKKIYLARDRSGEKPLYYFLDKEKKLFLFGSEIKSIIKHPEFEKKININVLDDYFRVNYISGNKSIYQNLLKLKPAHILQFSTEKFETHISPYWQYSLKSNLSIKYNENEILEKVEHLLNESIKNRMLSDVPIGCFLSGGIDSSLTASLMQKNSLKKINTFSIGFLDKSYDEAPFAKKIANYLGTNHHEQYLDKKSIADIVPTLSTVYDEPFADSSQIPTMLLSKFARQKVTVALSGDGADELFCGYDRYKLTPYIFNFFSKVPNAVKHFFFDYNNKNILREFLLNLPLFNFQILDNFKNKYNRLKKITNYQNFQQLYMNVISNEIDTSLILNKDLINKNCLFNNEIYEGSKLNNMLRFDYLEYLPNDILTKVDRASMYFSLETRTPFLEKNLINYISSIPNSIKLKNKKNKYILKKILGNYLPIEMFDRKKMGFGMPVTQMINHDLKEWSEDLLSEYNLKKSGFFNVANILKIYKDHKSYKKVNPNIIWSILNFQSWYLNNFK